MGGEAGSRSRVWLGPFLYTKGGSSRTLGNYDLMLWSVVEVWSCTRFLLSSSGNDSDPDPGSTASPSSDPLVGAPLFVLDVLDLLPKRPLLCHGWRNENVDPNERLRSGFDSDLAHLQLRVLVWRE